AEVVRGCGVQRRDLVRRSERPGLSDTPSGSVAVVVISPTRGQRKRQHAGTGQGQDLLHSPLPLVHGTRLWSPTVSIVGHTTSDGRHVKTMRDATASQYCNDAREAHAVPLVRGSDARREQQTA